MKFESRPILGKDGEVSLYDMYANGEWHGSRRTEAQCLDHYNYVLWLDKLTPEQRDIMDRLGYEALIRRFPKIR